MVCAGEGVAPCRAVVADTGEAVEATRGMSVAEAVCIIRARGNSIAHGRAIGATFSARVNVGLRQPTHVERSAVIAHDAPPRMDARPIIRARSEPPLTRCLTVDAPFRRRPQAAR